MFNLKNFWYNFRWDDYSGLYSSPLSRIVVAIPFVGYLLLFNDEIASWLKFETITGTDAEWSLFNKLQRLQLVYFGLISLSVGSGIYYYRRPFVIKQAPTQSAYVDFARRVFTYRDYLEITSEISREGHVTLYGDDALGEWDDLKVRLQPGHSVARGGKFSFTQALEDYSGTIASLAIENYTRHVRSRRGSLAAALVFSGLGYLLLLVPSFELFIRILVSIF